MIREYREVEPLMREDVEAGEIDINNERRADSVEHALKVATDHLGEREEEEPNGVYIDVSDLLANVRHFCDRAGLDYGMIDHHAHGAYLGDHETEPPAARDPERYPAPDQATMLDELSARIDAVEAGTADFGDAANVNNTLKRFERTPEVEALRKRIHALVLGT